MTGDWDFYFLQVDGRPASIYLDLSLAAAGPRAEYPWCAYVRLKMQAPRADGLSSQEEYAALIALEDALVAAATAEGGAIYAGRNTTDGRRDFYFFASHPRAFDDAVRAALGAFDGYGGEIGAREDRDWRTYFAFLLPPPPTRRSMLNRRVCDQLEQHGDDLALPRSIDHEATFPSAKAREDFAKAVGAAGFTVDGAPPPEGGAFRIFVSSVAAPAAIDAVVEELHAAAARFGGGYDGWGCEVVGPSATH